jgi:hypothetical protein
MNAAATAADRKTRFLALVADGSSPSAAARLVGVAKSTAHGWLHPEVNRKPRTRRIRRTRPAGTVSRPRPDAVLDAAPFAAWLQRIVWTRYGSDAEAARALGIDWSYLQRLMRPAPDARMTLALVDRVLVAAGDVHMLSILYPLDDEQEAA